MPDDYQDNYLQEEEYKVDRGVVNDQSHAGINELQFKSDN